jgi:hypothetical protein
VVAEQAARMNLTSAQSLTAWLWDAHPELVDLLIGQMPRQLGQCLSCDIDLFSGALCNGDFTSLSDPTLSLDSSSLDPSNIGCSPFTSISCSATDITGSTPSLACIPTIQESCLTPVNTAEVTGTCGIDSANLCCGSSIKGTNSATSNVLSGVASFLTSAQGLSALAKVAASYFSAKAAESTAAAKVAAAQATVVSAQTARAVTGSAAVPVTYVANANGTTSAMVSTTAGLVPLTSSILSGLTPSSIEVFLAQYGLWMLVGGAAVFLLYAASKRSSQT